MKTYNPLVSRTLVICGLAIALGGCPQDPNRNSMTIGTGGSGPGAGTGGSAGNPGSGGSTTGNGSGPIVGTPVATFSETPEGFVLSPYHEMPTSLQINLGDPNSGAAGGQAPPVMFDAKQGSPDLGSLLVTAPYSGANQYIDIQKSIMATPQNWMGKTLHVRIKVSSGTFKGGVQLYVKTGGFFVFGGMYTPLAPGQNWQEFTFNISSPMMPIAAYDPTNVVAYGLQLNSGSAGAGTMMVTFNVDSFSIFPPVAQMDAGAEGGTDANRDPSVDAAVDAGASDVITDLTASDVAATDVGAPDVAADSTAD